MKILFDVLWIRAGGRVKRMELRASPPGESLGEGGELTNLRCWPVCFSFVSFQETCLLESSSNNCSQAPSNETIILLTSFGVKKSSVNLAQNRKCQFHWGSLCRVFLQPETKPTSPFCHIPLLSSPLTRSTLMTRVGRKCAGSVFPPQIEPYRARNDLPRMITVTARWLWPMAEGRRNEKHGEGEGYIKRPNIKNIHECF